MRQYNFIRNYREKINKDFRAQSPEVQHGLDLGTKLGTCPAWSMCSFSINFINVVGKVKSSAHVTMPTSEKPQNLPNGLSLSACSEHAPSLDIQC